MDGYDNEYDPSLGMMMILMKKHYYKMNVKVV